jgi:hypothetical protein
VLRFRNLIVSFEFRLRFWRQGDAASIPERRRHLVGAACYHSNCNYVRTYTQCLLLRVSYGEEQELLRVPIPPNSYQLGVGRRHGCILVWWAGALWVRHLAPRRFRHDHRMASAYGNADFDQQWSWAGKRRVGEHFSKRKASAISRDDCDPRSHRRAVEGPTRVEQGD